MAPNNALGKPTATALRAAAEGGSARGQRRRKRSPAVPRDASLREATADGFDVGMVDKAEVSARGTGTARRTPLEEFEAQEHSELRAFWTGQ